MTRTLYLYLALIVASAAFTYKVTSNHYRLQIANIETTQAKAVADTERANTDILRAAQSLADVLSNSLANSEVAINKLTLEKTREIHHYATGNICFNAELSGLLNRTYSTLNNTPSATSTPDAENGTQPAPPETPAEPLTDTDVAEWVTYAQGEYATCSGRLAALIDFNTTDFNQGP
jgi:hypothetical protein